MAASMEPGCSVYACGINTFFLAMPKSETQGVTWIVRGLLVCQRLEIRLQSNLKTTRCGKTIPFIAATSKQTPKQQFQVRQRHQEEGSSERQCFRSHTHLYMYTHTLSSLAPRHLLIDVRLQLLLCSQRQRRKRTLPETAFLSCGALFLLLKGHWRE